MFWLSLILKSFGYLSRVGSKSLRTCLKAMVACPKLDATKRLSALVEFNGPSLSTVAARRPAHSVVLPFPRPTESAASRTSSRKAPANEP